MSVAKPFFDTNVVLYLLSSDAVKAQRAEDLMAAGGTLSVQVLNEFAHVAKRKHALSWAEIRHMTRALREVCVVEPLTEGTHDRGLEIASRLKISFYDATIVSSAVIAGCSTLYSEDLQHGRVVDDVLTIRNPFSTR